VGLPVVAGQSGRWPAAGQRTLVVRGPAADGLGKRLGNARSWTAGCFGGLVRVTLIPWLVAVSAGCQFFLPDWRDHLKTRRESGLLAGQAFFLTCGLSKN
jgi:hypothetical protein